MPYIITTTTRLPYPGEHDAASAVRTTRRAVVTLREAQSHVDEQVTAAFKRKNGPPAMREDAYEPFEAVGGTVGPLPDGTVIEVARVEWQDMIDALANDARNALWRESDWNIGGHKILDAYNEAHR